jgi:aryl-alcohol dehydrogenase-like predicted oxidoreductase
MPQETVQEIVRVSLEQGINWFDTAEVYGKGASEESLADALQTLHIDRNKYVIADKWFPAFRFAGSVEKTFPERERALKGLTIDLHQIHQPISFSRVEKQMDRMAKLFQQGKIRAVGVSNFNAEMMRRAHTRLAESGIPLASNQMRYSLLDREIERNEVLAAARELGVTIIAYSPLAQGILSGKFHNGEDVRSRQGPRKWLKRFKPEGLAATATLIEHVRTVASDHEVDSAQVALAWVTQRHGDAVVAIPGASSVRQAQSNAASMSVHLSPAELDLLDAAGREAEQRLKGPKKEQ